MKWNRLYGTAGWIKPKTAQAGQPKNNEPLVMTMTGEVFLPVRLYYRIHDKNAVGEIFNKLSCMDSDPANKRWTWLYHGAARSLKFKTPYAAIPKEQRPIIIGSFYSSSNEEMHLDVGSIERAVKAVVFFDKRICRTVAEIDYFAIYNELLPETKHPGANFDVLFAGVNKEESEAKREAAIASAVAAVKSGQFMELLNERRFELIESGPVNFYEDGIKSFEIALKIRQSIAFKRWQGEDTTFNDFIKAIAQGKK